jgi:predicted enzyme related to lactoylglutathione lyase
MVRAIRSLFEAHMIVRDLDRSIAFYCGVLGLPRAQASAEPKSPRCTAMRRSSRVKWLECWRLP